MADFNGGPAADNYTGTPDPDEAYGNGGDDVLNGAAGDDMLDGGDNDDRLIGGSGADLLFAGNGFNNVLFSDAEDPNYVRILQTGVSFDFGTEQDILIGGPGDDSLFVGIGDSADGGSQSFRGDKLFISFRGATAGVNADFRGLVNQGTVTVEGGTYKSIEEVVFMEGTEFDDILGAWGFPTSLNTAAGNTIYGRGGNDTIYTSASAGMGGSTVYGPSGIYGGDGDDVIDDTASRWGALAWGEAGDDYIFGGAGWGKYRGGDGNDRLEGNAGLDGLHGEAGNDIIDGGSFPDTLTGGDGNDTIYGAGDFDTIEGGDGDDIIYGDFSLISSANEHGTNNDDILRGDAGADTLYGDQGNDTLDGGTGADTMRGGTGNDIYYVDDAGDLVEENPGEGTDELRTTFAGYSLLGTNFENLRAASDVAHDFRGSEVDNVVAGGAGNDLLRLHDGGNDSAFGGAGNDALYFGAAFTGADKADGGEGTDVLILQGNYALTVSATSLAGLESISLQSGARTTWGDAANNFYDYSLTMSDAIVSGGQQLIVNAQSLRAGEDFTFDASAESDNGKYLVYGGHGVDILKGGIGGDVFFFEGNRWGPDDRVDGGLGRDSLVISAGSGVNHIEFGPNSIVSIESISLNARFASDPTQKPSYELVLDNGNVAAGASLIVNGSSIVDPAQTVSIDGSAVRNGTLTLFGGGGNDVLIGGFKGDTIQGGGGADIVEGGEGVDLLTGGEGADTFRYVGPYHSTAQLPDQILDFASGTDKIDLTGIDADVFTAGDQAFHWIGSSAFTGAGAASAGELRAWQSNGSWFVEGDMDGNGAPDLVIQLTTPVAPPVQGDFLL